MKNIFYLLIITSALFAVSCSEKELLPISASKGKPSAVTDIKVENVSGGAVISYRIPVEEDLLMVKAKYKLSDGRDYECSTSYFDNKIEVLGFVDENVHTVNLYTINRAQEMSDPVPVEIQPLESPLSKISKSLSIISDFGGARYIWDNVDEAPVSIDLLVMDSIGEMNVLKVVYTEAEHTWQALRGYESKARVFAAVIRDYWENTSDTIYPATDDHTLIPMFEEKLDKKKMNVMMLSNDKSMANWEGLNEYIIDDDLDTFGHFQASAIPAPLTIDLGVTAKLSRVVNWQRRFSDSYYNWGNPSLYEVWVKKDKPSQSGDWDEWTRLEDFKIIKPSGSPLNTVTDEDMIAAESGHEYTFELDQEPVRYIRFVVLETFGGTSFAHPCEFSFYGEIQN